MGKIRNEMKYGYSDITLVPQAHTRVRHRIECNPFVEGTRNSLPIFTAPMSQIVDEENYYFFKDSGVTPILPRNIDFARRVRALSDGWWTAFGLDETIKLIMDFPMIANEARTIRFCLDLANGHMDSVIQTCKDLKEVCAEHGVTCIVMTGNIANPQWVKDINLLYEEDNTPIDYVRCNIGSGSMCITSTQTKIHYPSASLIEECVEANFNHTVKIIADGGIKGYGDVITALGLGADYVMIGGLFAKSMEACGRMYSNANGRLKDYGDESVFHFNINAEEAWKKSLLEDYKPYRNYYGMASKKAQKEFGGNGNKTAEGKAEVVNVEYTLRGWIDNMIAYLRSAMSYTDALTLNEFRENAEFVVNSQGAINAVNK